MWMNLYELKQPLQSKEPTHFITAPAHRARTVPHALWIMEEKKKNHSICWATEYQLDLDCTRSLHTGAIKRANRSRYCSPSG